MRRIAKIVNFRVRGRSYLKLDRLKNHIGRRIVIVFSFYDGERRIIEGILQKVYITAKGIYYSCPIELKIGKELYVQRLKSDTDGTIVIFTKNRRNRKILFKDSDVLKKNNLLKSIDRAIARKVPSMVRGCYRDVKIIDEKCPKCGGQIVCVYDDLGGVDYYDNYAHICLNLDCDHVLHQESFTCNMGGGRADSESETCWFCNRPIEMTG